MGKKKLDEIISEELCSYENLLLASVAENNEIGYLNHIAEKYSLSQKLVVDKSLDTFNWYMKNGVDEYQAKIMSLYKTHEQIMRHCIK